MFGLTAKSPISEQAGQWIEASMARFAETFGLEACSTAVVALPTAECFPDEGGTPHERVQTFLNRVCAQMRVFPHSLELQFFEDEVEELEQGLKNSLPEWGSSRVSAAGFYKPRQEDKPLSAEDKALICIKSKQLADPISLVATLAHEVGHELLLGGNHVDRDAADMEPLTDLVTVYFGLGIFTANSAMRFAQYSDGVKAGWSVNRLGYLSEPMYGYTLAYFARMRQEANPTWVKYLKPNVVHYFKQSARFLKQRR